MIKLTQRIKVKLTFPPNRQTTTSRSRYSTFTPSSWVSSFYGRSRYLLFPYFFLFFLPLSSVLSLLNLSFLRPPSFARLRRPSHLKEREPATREISGPREGDGVQKPRRVGEEHPAKAGGVGAGDGVAWVPQPKPFLDATQGAPRSQGRLRDRPGLPRRTPGRNE